MELTPELAAQFQAFLAFQAQQAGTAPAPVVEAAPVHTLAPAPAPVADGNLTAGTTLAGGGAPFLKMSMGLDVKGRIVSIGRKQREKLKPVGSSFEVEGLLHFAKVGKGMVLANDPNAGDPVIDAILTIDTTFRAWEGVGGAREGADTGSRQIQVSYQRLVTAIREARQRAGRDFERIGDYLQIHVPGKGTPRNSSTNAPWLFTVAYHRMENPPVWADQVDAEVPQVASGTPAVASSPMPVEAGPAPVAPGAGTGLASFL